jgi:ATP-dependent Lon protease
MERTNEHESLTVLPLFETIIFPHIKTKIKIGKKSGVSFFEKSNSGPFSAIGLAVKENTSRANLREGDFHLVGTMLRIESIQDTNNGYLLFVDSLEKVEARNIKAAGNGFKSEYSILADDNDLDENSRKEMIEFIKSTVEELSHNFQGAEQFVKPIFQQTEIARIIGSILPYMPLTTEEKQSLLEMSSIREKSLKFIDHLLKQKETISLQIEMAKKFSEKTNKNYRQTLLREQMKAIQEELNDSDGSESGEGGYKEKIEKSDMPPEVKKIALSEFGKLEQAGNNNPESHIIRNYLDLLIALPWETDSAKEIDIDRAREVLENGHFGLEKVKERIIQHLAVMKLKKEKQGSILLLVGPPGTGKTSLGKSIAEALGRKYVRMSLGGIRDEAEIRGHRRTYIGALPGRIIHGMKKAGEKNPVFVLDEIDKVMASYAGDPSSALLEVLDPEQNNSFTDHYLEVPYDLSDVFFIATANSLSSIPAPLIDRTEVIQISSYTNLEKFSIGKEHLLEQVLEEHGLDSSQLLIEDDVIRGIIEKYTREAGVRGLKKQLAKVARNASEKIVSKDISLPYTVNTELLDEILGREMIRLDEVQKESVPGVVTGLAWTPVGGDILFIEGTFMGGKGDLTLTGQLGDVMKESARISLSLIRSRLAHAIGKFDFIKNDIHIHVPSGATPKDGPSAGITLFTALASLFLGKKVDPKTAMTGEITLRGSVMPVGGIKEKIIAAHRAGVKKVILPKDNEKDLEDVPDEVKNDLKFVFVETIEEVLKEALNVELPRPEHLLSTASNESYTSI